MPANPTPLLASAIAPATHTSPRDAAPVIGQRDALAALVAIAAFLTFWTLLTTWSQATASADNIEQLVWAQRFAWGYPKHPPLPTWLLIAASAAFGRSVALTYALAAACVGAALAIMWLACARLAGRHAALTALLLSTCIYYFNGRSGYFNHNTVLLPFVAAAYLAFVEVVATRRMRAWCALGAAIGVGMLAKYQMALFAFTFLAWLGAAGELRSRRGATGAAACALVACAIVAPHMVWQWHHGWPAFGYAARNLDASLDPAGRLLGAAGFIGQQVARMLPALVVFGLVRGWHGGRPSPGAPAARALPPAPAALRDAPAQRAGRAFVFCAVVPVLGIAALALASGSRLQNHWGVTAVLALLPAAAVVLGARAVVPVRRLLVAVVLCHGLTAALFVVPRFVSARDHQTFPAAALAAQADAFWRSRSAAALQVVIGPQWEAGALALQLADRPAVLSVEERHLWTADEARLAARCGALVVWNADVPAHRAVARRLRLAAGATAELVAPRELAPAARPARLGVAVLAPTAAAGCETADIVLPHARP